MATCHLCEKKLGFFSKSVPLDGHRFCPTPCAPQWRAQRKERAVGALCRDGGPAGLFSIPELRTRDPDKPKGSTLLLGVLAFLDKGVCFVQIAETKKADSGMGIAFGLIGALIAEGRAKRRRQEAYAMGEREILGDNKSITQILADAQRLIFYPADQITKLRLTSGLVEVRTADGKNRFALANGRKTCKRFKPLFDAYARAIQAGSDPILECKPLLGDGTA